MSLFITKINQASSNTEFVYLDSEHLWYKNTSASYSFYIYDVQYRDGDDHLLEGIDALKKAYERREIAAKIGIDEFKNGNILSLTLPESNRVGKTEASITIEERERVSDDESLSLITDNIPSPQNIASFNEDFSFSRSDNTYNYSRGISLSYSYDPSNSFLNNAYLFLKNIYLGNRPSFGYLNDGISENGRFNLGLKPQISEFYDLINKEVRLTENFSSSRIISSNGISFSRNQTNTHSLNKEGYTEKTYTVEIKALQEPLETTLNSGIQISLEEILAENTGVYFNPITIEKTANENGGVGNLSVSFTNDPRKNQTTTVDYSATEDQGDDFNKYSFKMDVSTKGYNWNSAFETSKNYLNTNKNIGLEKISSLFNVSSGDLNEFSRSISYSPINKKASQTVQYTLDPGYKDNNDGILKRKINISEINPLSRHEVVPLYGASELAIVNDSAKTVGIKSVTVDITSLNTGVVQEAFEIASGEVPDNAYYYLDKKDSTQNLLGNSASVSMDFLFFD